MQRLPLVLTIIVVAVGAYTIGFAQGKTHAPSGGQAANTVQAAPTTPTVQTPALGSKSAKLTVYEYADYQCPYCSVFTTQMMPQLKKDFIDTGKVRFVFNNAPLLGDESIYSDAAAYCANDQGKYWQYHDELYMITSEKNGDEAHPVLNKGIFSTANLKQYAADAHLDMLAFDQCIDSQKYVATAVADATAATKAGIKGTPYFKIGNQTFDGLQPYSIIKSLIEAQL